MTIQLSMDCIFITHSLISICIKLNMTSALTKQLSYTAGYHSIQQNSIYCTTKPDLDDKRLHLYSPLSVSPCISAVFNKWLGSPDIDSVRGRWSVVVGA